MRQGMFTLSSRSTTSHFGYLHLVYLTLFGKSSKLLHVDFWPHEELIYIMHTCIFILFKTLPSHFIKYISSTVYNKPFDHLFPTSCEEDSGCCVDPGDGVNLCCHAGQLKGHDDREGLRVDEAHAVVDVSDQQVLNGQRVPLKVRDRVLLVRTLHRLRP